MKCSVVQSTLLYCSGIRSSRVSSKRHRITCSIFDDYGAINVLLSGHFWHGNAIFMFSCNLDNVTHRMMYYRCRVSGCYGLHGRHRVGLNNVKLLINNVTITNSMALSRSVSSLCRITPTCDNLNEPTLGRRFRHTLWISCSYHGLQTTTTKVWCVTRASECISDVFEGEFSV